jgi:predicted nucleic acid binding AN1-type Zn finger protein
VTLDGVVHATVALSLLPIVSLSLAFIVNKYIYKSDDDA